MCEHVAIKTHHSINMFSKMTFENAYAILNEHNDHSGCRCIIHHCSFSDFWVPVWVQESVEEWILSRADGVIDSTSWWVLEVSCPASKALRVIGSCWRRSSCCLTIMMITDTSLQRAEHHQHVTQTQTHYTRMAFSLETTNICLWSYYYIHYCSKVWDFPRA